MDVETDGSATCASPRLPQYGDGDGYSVHEGSCQFGSIPYPYFIGAVSDNVVRQRSEPS